MYQMPHMRLEEQQMGVRRYQDVERGGSVQGGGGGAAAQVHVGTHPLAIDRMSRTLIDLCRCLFRSLCWCDGIV